MDIKRGNLYRNRTWLYLFPLIKTYGIDLETYLKSFFKLAVGIGDFNNSHTEPTFCILIDAGVDIRSKATENGEGFSEFLDWFRMQDFYLDDYMYDVETPELHMLVIKFPEKFMKAYDNFLIGKYSEMYDKYHVDTLFEILPNPKKSTVIEFRNKQFTSIREVLLKAPRRKKEFIALVNKQFGTEVEEHFFENAELDFAPSLKEEIFSYELEK